MQSTRHRKRVALRLVGLTLVALIVIVLAAVVIKLIIDRRADFASAAAPLMPLATQTTSAEPTPAPTTTQTPPTTQAPSTAPTRSPEDEQFLGLLEVSGFGSTDEAGESYIASAQTACTQLETGRDGASVVASSVRAAQDSGFDAQQGEGLVYIGVATYCSDLLPELP